MSLSSFRAHELLLGIGSGAAMIPCTIIKEVNADEVKGSATGAIKFSRFHAECPDGPGLTAGF
jgi:hypothetical protein